MDEKVENSSIKNTFTLPDLDINSDNENEVADEIEPIVFHPALEQVEKLTDDDEVELPLHQSMGDHSQQLDEKASQDVDVKPYQFVDNFPEERSDLIDMTRVLTEIELDNALIDKEVCSQPSCSESSQCFNDSGSSNSSLMGKLENCMKAVKDETEDDHINDIAPKKTITKIIPCEDSLKSEIRSPSKFTLNESVAKRYKSSSVIDVHDDMMYERTKIKRESESILKAHGRSMEEQSYESLDDFEKNEETNMNFKENNVLSNNSPSMVKCVDSMLENVNTIIYQISDPGKDLKPNLIKENGEVEKLYSDVGVQSIEKPEECVQIDRADKASDLNHLKNQKNTANTSTQSSGPIETQVSRNILKSTKARKPLQTPEVSSHSKGTYDYSKEQENVLKLTSELRDEIKDDILKEEGESHKLTRELVFDSDRRLQHSSKDQLSSSCLACLQSETDETPLKHDVLRCKKESFEKTVCSIGVSTKDLTSSACENETVSLCQEETQLQKNLSKNSKKKKKKKSKSTGKNINSTMEEGTKVESNEQKPSSFLSNDCSREDNEIKEECAEIEKQFIQIVQQLEEITNQKVLLHKDVSLDVGYSFIPPAISKELLLLKIVLESPGVLKAPSNETRNPTFDESSRNTYIGLVTLFIFLMHSNALKYQFASPDVPFDVVSLFQCFMDDELVLFVGVCENEKSYQHKSKRTKLGSYFFHAVSQFLNNNTLEQLLIRISPGDNCLGNFSKIFHGKLSSLINVMPDSTALQRIISTNHSFVLQNNTKLLRNLSDLNLPSVTTTKNNDDELTCITLENVNTMPPKTVASVLKNVYIQSLEIVGLRIGYVPQVNNPNIVRSVLAICIQDNKVTSSAQGHLLFGKNPELKDLTISFQLFDEKQVSTLPTLRYTLNENRAFKRVVQWFGPHFKDISELKELSENLKSKAKILNKQKNKKKTWTADNPSSVSLLCNFTSHAIVLVSSLVPSWLIPQIIISAKKKGIYLESMSKNVVSLEVLNSLGISEKSCRFYGNSSMIWKNTSRGPIESGSLTFLLFRGKSSGVRLNNLMDNFAKYLNNGESFSNIHQTFDNVKVLKAWHDDRLRSRFYAKYQSFDYFSILQLNENSSQLGAPYHLASKLQLNDLRSHLARECFVPNISLAALIVYGPSMLSEIANILRLTFFGQSEMISESLIGIKVIEDLTSYDAHGLVTEEPQTNSWRKQIEKLTQNKILLLIVKTKDFRCLSQLRTSVANFLHSSKADVDNNGIIIHSDTKNIFDLMFMYFHPNELFQGMKVDSKLVTCAYLEETHPFLTIFDKLYKLNLSNSVIVKKCLPDTVKVEEEGFFDHIVYQIHPQSMNYPCELLLRQQVSFCGLSIKYSDEDFISIMKAISRIVRFGFRIVAWKFPVRHTNSYWLSVVFRRSDALYFLDYIMTEIETNFQNLKFEVTKSLVDLIMFVKDNFCSNLSGGLFHVNYTSLLNKMSFTTDELICSKDKRSLEWNPLNSSIGRQFQRHHPKTMIGESSREVSVVIFTAPLINGHFAGTSFPRSCIFPEVFQTLESINYRCLASRMTSLDANFSEQVLDIYGVHDKKRRYLMKSYLTSPSEPFVVVVLVGVCIQSNFWLEIERVHCEEEDVAILKKFTLTTSSKGQVNFLVPAFFDGVLPNSKIEVQTSMTEFPAGEKESQLLL